MSGDLTPDDGKLKGCETVMELGFGACKLQVQVPVNGSYVKSKDLIGKNIGTSFVHLTEEYFSRLETEDNEANGTDGDFPPQKLRTKIIELSGSVEAACALGVADGIVDLVGELPLFQQLAGCPMPDQPVKPSLQGLWHTSYFLATPVHWHGLILFTHTIMNSLLTWPPPESGETMKAAGLEAIDTVVESSSILIKSKSPAHPDLVELIASRIRGVIAAQKYVMCQYNIPRSHITEATKITPGKRAPTVTSLEEEGWVAISVMVERKRIAVAMDDLARVGATDILVLDIANSRVD